MYLEWSCAYTGSAEPEQDLSVPFICSLVMLSERVGGTLVSHSGSYG